MNRGILNEELTIGFREKNTFRFPPKRVLLTVGTVLYRFVTPSENQILEGAYWMNQSTYDRIRRYAKDRESMGEVARAWGAVNEKWNSRMNCICKIILTASCYAWVGPAKHQPSTKGRNISFMGNGEQIFLPNLSIKNASLQWFAHN